ncbi:MAG: IS66 family insertion sequence element accessory protein TnpB, partial [Neglectibacter sp.]
VYIACGYTDLRKGIDGLATMVQQQFELDPFTNTLFLFCGRKRDRIKGLYWERDGFILLYKRLEQGAYQWPRSEVEVKMLMPQQYRWLMEGLKIEQPKAHKAVTGLSMVCIENWMLFSRKPLKNWYFKGFYVIIKIYENEVNITRKRNDDHFPCEYSL